MKRFPIYTLILALYGCNFARIQQQNNRPPANKTGLQQPALDGQNPNTPQADLPSTIPDDTGYISNEKFPVFDPRYDFVRDKKTTASELARKYPVFPTAELSTLASGEDYLRSRTNLIDAARKSIDIQTLLFHGDESGVLIADRLIAAKNRGVTVRVSIDPISNFDLKSQSVMSKIKNSGIFVEGWEPLYLYVLSMYKPTDGIQDILDDANQRGHEKMFIVDSGTPQAAAILGGTNIGNEYFRISKNDPKTRWIDKDIILKGPIVETIQTSYNETLQKLADFRQNHAIFDAQPLWSYLSSLRDLLGKKPSSIISDFKLDSDLKKQFNDIAGTTQSYNWRTARTRYLLSRPRDSETYIYRAYIDFIKNSKKEIILCHAYFLPQQEIRNALIEAAKNRGVRVRILTNSRESNDNPTVTDAGRTYYRELLGGSPQNPIEIYEWGGHKNLNNFEGLMHSKFGVFDRQASLVGSYNIDPRSENLNSENIVAIDQPEIAEELSREVESYLTTKYSTKMDESKIVKFTEGADALTKIKNQFIGSLIPVL